MRRSVGEIIPVSEAVLAALLLARSASLSGGLLPRRLRSAARHGASAARRGPDIAARRACTAAEGQRRKRVALLAGCAQQGARSRINAATIRMLTRHGCEFVIAQGAGCCGASPCIWDGRRSANSALQMSRHGRQAPRAAGSTPWSINASGCGTTVKDYGHLFAHPMGRSASRASRLRYQLKFSPSSASRRRPMPPAIGWPTTIRARCSTSSMWHPAASAVEGGRVQCLEVPEKHFCCGSAGTYNLLQPEIGDGAGPAQGRSHVESVDPDIIAAGNLGCMMQIGRYSTIPIVHTVELSTGRPAGRDRRRWRAVPCASRRHRECHRGASVQAEPNGSLTRGIW